MRARALFPTLLFVVLIVAGAAAGEWYVSLAEGPNEVVCQVPGAEPSATPRWEAKKKPTAGASLARLPDVPEASGLALSRRTPGLMWTFNDSSEPIIYAVDGKGTLAGRVRVQGATVRNWEDISAGACGGRSCLYIADVGDNRERRAEITIYRVAEPAPTDTATAPADTYVARYPDHPHDAEAVFVAGSEQLFVVTKDKPATIYRFPRPLKAGGTMTLQEVALLPMEGVTDAETSPDDAWVGIRSKEEMIFFRTRALVSGDTEHGTPVNLRGLGEPQGEGLAIASDGTVYLAGEGGGHHAPGTFTSVTCRFPKTTTPNAQPPTPNRR